MIAAADAVNFFCVVRIILSRKPRGIFSQIVPIIFLNIKATFPFQKHPSLLEDTPC